MPELPEVETVRRGLEEVAVGRRFTAVRVSGRRTVRRQAPAELVDRLTGRRLEAAGRRGKFLLGSLDDGSVLVVHLRMSGQLLYVERPAEVPLAPHTHVVADLDGGPELRFVDPRTFGEWFVADDPDDRGVPGVLAHLGRDPLLDGLPADFLAGRLAGRSASLKALVTDQRIVAGVGNLYADEALYRARLRPDRTGGSLTGDEVRRLAGAIRQVLRQAVRLGGSSLRDLGYRDLMGGYGNYQTHHAVYDRAGEACERCGGEVVRQKIGARAAYCCLGCQS